MTVVRARGQGQWSGIMVRGHGVKGSELKMESGVRGQGVWWVGGGLVDDTGQGVRGQVPGVRPQGSGLCS